MRKHVVHSLYCDFSRIVDETSGDITCVCVSAGWAPEASGPEKGPTRRLQGRVWCFFPSDIAVCKFSRTYLSMLWSSITNAFHVDNNFQWCLVVKQSSQEEVGAATPCKGTAKPSHLEEGSLPSRAKPFFVF